MRKGLLIGINQYPRVPLGGCRNDVRDLAALLWAQYRLRPGEVVGLVDEQATRDGILGALDTFVSGLHPGDRGVFYFSGHGASIPVTERDGTEVAEDCICPIEFAWTRETSVMGSEVGQILSRLPAGASVVWIADSCHAGDLLPDSARTPPPPEHIALARAGRPRRRLHHFLAAHTNLEIALVAACGPQEIAQDALVAGQTRGAFSYFVFRQLRGAGGRPSLRPLAEVVTRATRQLQANGFPQEPELQGSEDVLRAPLLAAGRWPVSTFRVKDLMIKVLPKGGGGRLDCEVTCFDAGNASIDTGCGASDCGATDCGDASGCGDCSYGCSGQCTCSFGCSNNCSVGETGCGPCTDFTCGHCSGGCTGDCSHGCTDGCTHACSNACSHPCTNACSNACSGNACSGGCTGACSGGCTGACSKGCSAACSHGCTAGCTRCSGEVSVCGCSRLPCTAPSGPNRGDFSRMRSEDLGTLKQHLRNALGSIATHEARQSNVPRAPQTHSDLDLLEQKLKEGLEEVKAMRAKLAAEDKDKKKP